MNVQPVVVTMNPCPVIMVFPPDFATVLLVPLCLTGDDLLFFIRLYFQIQLAVITDTT